MAPHHAWAAPRDREGEGEGMARHIRAMHELLGIRPDQEPAFQAVIAALRPPMRDQEGGVPHPDLSNLPTPERLERMAQIMDAREAMMREHMHRMIGAVRALYDVLSPEQRRILDNLPGLVMPGMMHGGMGMDMERGHHGGDGGMGPPPPPPPPQ